jgi:hypothetical protein
MNSKKLLSLASLFLSLPSLVSAAVSVPGRFGSMIVGPIPSSGAMSFTMVYVCLIPYDHILRITIGNSKTAGLSSQVYPVLPATLYQGAVGKTISADLSVPQEYLSDSNSFHLYASAQSYSVQIDFSLARPVGVTMSLPSAFSLKSEAYAVLIKQNVYYPIRDEYSHSGFLAEYENPRGGRMPLETLQIRRINSNSDGFFHYKKATLILKDHCEDFVIGEHIGIFYKTVRFPLSFSKNGYNDYFSCSLRDSYALDPANRAMRNAEERKSGDRLVSKLYFPVRKGGSPRTYSFSIEIEGAGDEFSTARIVYSFKVLLTKNFVGGCLGSDYCVGVL